MVNKSKTTLASEAQPQLAGLGTGAVVIFDGGRRVRLDDKVDYWPATGRWQALDTAESGQEPLSGEGMPSLLAYLKAQRELAGNPVLDPVPLATNRTVVCDYCRQPAELHSALEVFPDRRDLEDRNMWVCWDCNAWVGCHRDTDKPFGGLANEELRDARQRAHASFDPLWEQGRMSRHEAYTWLAKAMNIPLERCHIGMFRLEDCQRARQLVQDAFEQP